MTDFNQPTTASTYSGLLADLKGRDVSIAKMFNGTSDTNIPSDAVGYDSGSDWLRIWNGSSWVDILVGVKDHLAIDALAPGNPHGTTAAMVGAPTLTAFNNHANDTANPHETTAAQVGAPSLAAFTGHTSNVSNPHGVTAAQAGALSIANKLSELSSSPTVRDAARANIDAASATTFAAHVANTSNPHGTSLANIVNGPAAKAGTNTDLTALNAATAVGSTSSSLTLNAASAGNFLFNFGGTTKFKANNSALIVPSGTDYNLGDTSNLWNHIFFKGKLRRSSGVIGWSFFPSQPTSIPSLDTELSTGSFGASFSGADTLLRATARAVNQLYKVAVDHGLVDQV
jgi:hypothetical protein